MKRYKALLEDRRNILPKDFDGVVLKEFLDGKDFESIFIFDSKKLKIIKRL